MRIVIVGAGNTGIQLAKYLIQERHDVSIIESNEDRARFVSNRFDCMVIHDKGSNIGALKDAGIQKADALVCLTGYDEINMLVCGLAASHFSGSRPKESGSLLKIAKVNSDDYMYLNKSVAMNVLGIDYFIHPDIVVASSIIRIIEHGAIGNIFSFANTPYELGSIDIAEGSAMDGLVLSDYRKLVSCESLITLVEHEEEVMLPSGSTVLKKGDHVHVLADEKNLPQIYKLAGDIQKPIKKIGIAGGGRLGSLVAEGLMNSGKSYRIVIIEKNSKQCNDLAARFPSALILNNDISDESFINEEELDNLDCLITATDSGELNIITAVYLKSRGIARTIALVTGSGHATMARHLGVDVVIPLRSIVVDSILSHLMGSGVKEVRSLGDDNVDLIEVEIGDGAPVIDKPISSFRLSSGGLLLLVNRGDESFIPKGDYVFKKGDRIVLVAKTGSQAEIKKYFNTGK